MTANGRERLDVVAALLSFDGPRSDAADAWVAPDGSMLSDDEAALIDSATEDEWALAEGLSGTAEPVSDPGAEPIAGLLRLAAGTDAAVMLTLRMREAFAPGGDPVRRTQAERSEVFADVYNRLALPGLAGAAREQAAALLPRIGALATPQYPAPA